MRILCPHCGERDAQEFSYAGDATKPRPGGLDAREDVMFDYVYLRDNPAGPHRELWHHGAGCRAWLVVTRDTRTHRILGVETARYAALGREGAA
jgi:sarcosine oxidase subunit delta